jgi:uncharacterized delta-60 repeat protein
LLAAPGDPALAFGGDGRATTPIEDYSNCFFKFVAPTPDAKIMAAGQCLRRDAHQSLGALLVARFNVDGSPDLTFNGTGHLLKNLYSPGSENPDFMTGRSAANFALSDGKLLVVGTALRGEDPDPTGIIRWARNDIALFRFKADGWPDPEFGTNGEVITELPDGTSSARTRWR